MKYDYHIFLKKAEESLNTANFCFEKQCYNSCVNRAYYAMFQVAAAVLFKAGIRPKSKIGHDWVQAGLMKMSQTELPIVIPFLFRLFFST